MRYINTFQEGEQISDIYFCKQKTQATTKAGKTYYSLILQDKTGSVDAKVWELNNAIEHFEVKDFIKIDARVTSFNNALQLNVARIRRADVSEYVLSDYMPCSEYNIYEIYKYLSSRNFNNYPMNYNLKADRKNCKKIM